MIRGIAIMGLNGCGKSTLAHALGKKLDFFEIDVEDYYFPEQKANRQANLEHQQDVQCKYRGELPYSVPCSKIEVQEMIREDIKKHPQFIISGVTMNWEETILSAIDVVFILEAPTNERIKRVQQREELRFGSRVLPGGDMYEQQKSFRDSIAAKTHQSVEESADRIPCKKVKLDGTKNIDENVDTIFKTLEEMNYLNY